MCYKWLVYLSRDSAYVLLSFPFCSFISWLERERESVSWTFCCDYTEHTSRTHHMCAMHWLASCLKRVLRVVFISGRLSCQSICVLHVHVCVFFALFFFVRFRFISFMRHFRFIIFSGGELKFYDWNEFAWKSHNLKAIVSAVPG